MTEKTFLFINFFYLQIFTFYVKTATPLKKGHPPLSQHPLLKIEILSSTPPPLFFQNLVGGSIPPVEMGGGRGCAHYSTYLHKNEMQIKIH